jgi:hypothetical protein
MNSGVKTLQLNFPLQGIYSYECNNTFCFIGRGNDV